MQDPTKEGQEEDKKEGGVYQCTRGKWSEKRAVILTKPQEVLEGDPGAYIIAEVEV
jgi:uncharacterized cupin superfamily protein